MNHFQRVIEMNYPHWRLSKDHEEHTINYAHCYLCQRPLFITLNQLDEEIDKEVNKLINEQIK